MNHNFFAFVYGQLINQHFYLTTVFIHWVKNPDYNHILYV